MAIKHNLRTALADAVEDTCKLPNGELKLCALGALHDLVVEFKEDLELELGEQKALIEINKQQGNK